MNLGVSDLTGFTVVFNFFEERPISIKLFFNSMHSPSICINFSFEVILTHHLHAF